MVSFAGAKTGPADLSKQLGSVRHRRMLAVLRGLREDAGLTTREVGKIIGRNHTFVSRYELGSRRLDALELAELCEKLGHDPVAVYRKIVRGR
jgi:transcriptional regulator with XRE-family HTH domain